MVEESNSSGLKDEQVVIHVQPYEFTTGVGAKKTRRLGDVVDAFLTKKDFPPYGGLKVVGAVYEDGWACLGFCYGQYDHELFLYDVIYELKRVRGSYPLASQIDCGGGDVDRGQTTVKNESHSLGRPLPLALTEAAERYLLERIAQLSS